MSNVVVSLNISTAAMIQPIDGAAVLGKPGDWSKPNKYEITAADGSKRYGLLQRISYKNNFLNK